MSIAQTDRRTATGRSSRPDLQTDEGDGDGGVNSRRRGMSTEMSDGGLEWNCFFSLSVPVGLGRLPSFSSPPPPLPPPHVGPPPHERTRGIQTICLMNSAASEGRVSHRGGRKRKTIAIAMAALDTDAHPAGDGDEEEKRSSTSYFVVVDVIIIRTLPERDLCLWPPRSSSP